MIERSMLEVPPFLPRSRYAASCRAVLVVATCLGLQVIIVLMLGLGPLPELPYDPSTLTGAGRYFLAAELDTEAYAAGCAATVLLACAGSWIWNRLLFRVGAGAADSVARLATRILWGVALASTLVFAGAILWVAPRLAGSRLVPIGDLVLLCSPGVLALLGLAGLLGRAWRASSGRST